MKTIFVLSALFLASTANAASLQSLFDQREKDAGRRSQLLAAQCKAARAALANSLIPAAIENLEKITGTNLEKNEFPKKLKQTNSEAFADIFSAEGYVQLSGNEICKLTMNFYGNGPLASRRTVIGIDAKALCTDEQGNQSAYDIGKGVEADSGCFF